LIGRLQAIAGEAAVVVGETGERVHNELPMPAVAMGILSFLALVALLWVTTRFNPDR
jgi:hypothetical protein